MIELRPAMRVTPWVRASNGYAALFQLRVDGRGDCSPWIVSVWVSPGGTPLVHDLGLEVCGENCSRRVHPRIYTALKDAVHEGGMPRRTCTPEVEDVPDL